MSHDWPYEHRLVRSAPSASISACARSVSAANTQRPARRRELLVAAVQLAGREVESHVRGEQAEGGQGSGMRRDDHGCDREAPRELGRVERAGTAEGDERVIPRIVPTLAECHPDGAFHRRVHHLDGSRGRLVAAKPSASANGSIAARASSTSSARRLASGKSGVSRPRSSWQSVTVGSPPRP